MAGSQDWLRLLVTIFLLLVISQNVSQASQKIDERGTVGYYFPVRMAEKASHLGEPGPEHLAVATILCLCGKCRALGS